MTLARTRVKKLSRQVGVLMHELSEDDPEAYELLKEYHHALRGAVIELRVELRELRAKELT